MIRNHWKKMLLGLAVLVPLTAWATLPKASWSAGDRLRAADLTADMQHLEAALRGGTHTAIVNADISAGALIDHSKLSVPALIPKLWTSVYSATPCDGATSATCTMIAGSGVASVVGDGGDGRYVVTFTAARPNVAYGALVTANAVNVFCYVDNLTTTTVGVFCRNAGDTFTDTNFTVMLMDNDN